MCGTYSEAVGTITVSYEPDLERHKFHSDFHPPNSFVGRRNGHQKAFMDTKYFQLSIGNIY